MKKNILTLLNISLFLAIFIGMPYIAGRWVLLCLSWLPAGFVFQLIEDALDEMNRNNNKNKNKTK